MGGVPAVIPNLHMLSYKKLLDRRWEVSALVYRRQEEKEELVFDTAEETDECEEHKNWKAMNEKHV